ncbi:2OG-Fe dioxygenase family protein [Polyangium sp. 15x6]|uniref:2OG-Fe dioxygenase family protein n=1 Tax=Polyangium sp. 15x6 TaxID=3042687 RepID=UPI00249BA1B5|nr:2OG-Fe dioxygenase family protein [Polyangium sp. 15x6]MDI3289870.1 2OG-Fe dioxygenase family protein [Polyangium sp. 15x6]
MSPAEFEPPITPASDIVETVRRQGFAVASSSWAQGLTGAPRPDWAKIAAEWDDMPLDPYLKDGGHYRRRRHASFIVDEASCRLVPHRAHFQPLQYNALHGGMERWFEPMRQDMIGQPFWSDLLTSLARVCSEIKRPSSVPRSGATLGQAELRPRTPWYVEAHQFRIDTSEGIGRPTPEGAHRDGVDFVALFLIGRHGIRGGETRVFDARGPQGIRFTLTEPWSFLLLDDERVIHESTPIQPLLGGESGTLPHGHRDTLVLTYRRNGFQDR